MHCLLTLLLLLALLVSCFGDSNEETADLLIKSSRSTEAIDFITPLLDNPETDSPSLRINLARAFTQQRNNAAAERVLIDLQGRFPGNPEGLVALSKLQLYSQKFFEAEMTLRQLTAIDADDSSVVVGFAKISAYRDNDCNKAVTTLKRLHSISDANAYFDAGVIFFRCGEYSLGKEAFGAYEAIISPNIDYKLLGRIYFTYHQYEWSMRALQRFLETHPQQSPPDVEVLLLLAETKDVLGFPREAERLFRAVIETQPSNAIAHGTHMPYPCRF